MQEPEEDEQQLQQQPEQHDLHSPLSFGKECGKYMLGCVMVYLLLTVGIVLGTWNTRAAPAGYQWKREEEALQAAWKHYREDEAASLQEHGRLLAEVELQLQQLQRNASEQVSKIQKEMILPLQAAKERVSVMRATLATISNALANQAAATHKETDIVDWADRQNESGILNFLSKRLINICLRMEERNDTSIDPSVHADNATQLLPHFWNLMNISNLSNSSSTGTAFNTSDAQQLMKLIRLAQADLKRVGDKAADAYTTYDAESIVIPWHSIGYVMDRNAKLYPSKNMTAMLLAANATPYTCYGDDSSYYYYLSSNATATTNSTNATAAAALKGLNAAVAYITDEQAQEALQEFRDLLDTRYDDGSNVTSTNNNNTNGTVDEKDKLLDVSWLPLLNKTRKEEMKVALAAAIQKQVEMRNQVLANLTVQAAANATAQELELAAKIQHEKELAEKEAELELNKTLAAVLTTSTTATLSLSKMDEKYKNPDPNLCLKSAKEVVAWMDAGLDALYRRKDVRQALYKVVRQTAKTFDPTKLILDDPSLELLTSNSLFPVTASSNMDLPAALRLKNKRSMSSASSAMITPPPHLPTHVSLRQVLDRPLIVHELPHVLDWAAEFVGGHYDAVDEWLQQLPEDFAQQAVTKLLQHAGKVPISIPTVRNSELLYQWQDKTGILFPK